VVQKDAQNCSQEDRCKGQEEGLGPLLMTCINALAIYNYAHLQVYRLDLSDSADVAAFVT
jgi:hypothetical protein